jgi:hypothetical protein
MISNNYVTDVNTIAFCFCYKWTIWFILIQHHMSMYNTCTSVWIIGKILDVITTPQGMQGFPQAHISFELHMIHPRIL